MTRKGLGRTSLSEMDGQRILPRKSKSRQETIYHRYAAAERNRPASYGTCIDETMQDILIRFKRMQGYEALWQPGTDHAAIATESKSSTS